MTYDEGGGGVGKSYIAQQESACIAAGHPVLGEPVEQTDVFYLNYEEPEDEFLRRLERIEYGFGARTAPDGRTREEWDAAYPPRCGHPEWPHRELTHRPLDTSRLFARHLRDHEGAHILRVTAKGEIILTRFGRVFLALLAGRRDRGMHSYVVFDGLMDAILFEGGTRMDDSVARQVIALLDRWCVEYDFTGRGIIHPSRAGERSDTGSYAPAWTTKPRSLQTYKRVTFAGKAVTDHVPADQIFTRRKITKRSHGQPGHYVDLQYLHGIWQPLGGGGGENAIDVAVEIAIRHDNMDQRIKKDCTIGKQRTPLSNQHALIAEYRQRVGAQHGVAHFLNSLSTAADEGRIEYQEGTSHKPAGYRRPD